MTNEQIILSNRVFLMEQGFLGGTGTTFIYEDEKGKREIEMPEPIHTFRTWKKLGYSVKKGEHAVARFPIWHRSKGHKSNNEDEEQLEGGDNNGYFYMKVAFFFTKSQVTAIND